MFMEYISKFKFLSGMTMLYYVIVMNKSTLNIWAYGPLF